MNTLRKNGVTDFYTLLKKRAGKEHKNSGRRASSMSAARPATEERAEQKQPRPGANMSLHSTCAPLPQQDMVYSSS
jgi:hypothetical protein